MLSNPNKGKEEQTEITNIWDWKRESQKKEKYLLTYFSFWNNIDPIPMSQILFMIRSVDMQHSDHLK